MKVIKSFCDPLTEKPYRRGTDYICSDIEHMEMLQRAGYLDAGSSNPDPATQSAMPPVSKEPEKPKRKRGVKDGDV